jgi:hypothetical protein
MVLMFGFLVAAVCWGYQVSLFFNTGNWSPVPFLPFVDQWLPATFFAWLSQPTNAVELSRYTSWVLNNNAGLLVFIFTYLLQIAVKPRG